MVVVTPLRWYPITFSCCIILVKQSELKLQRFSFNWCDEQIIFYHKNAKSCTVLYIEVLKISNY